MDNKITMGLKETKEAVDFAIAVGTGVDKALADGKINFADIPVFLPSFLALVPAVENAEQIPLEFKLANEDEINELKAYIKSQLDLRDDQLEKFIEDAFGLALTVWLLVKIYFVKPTPQAVDEKTADTSPDAAEVQ